VEAGDVRRRLIGIASLIVLFDGRILKLSPPLFQKTFTKLDASFAEHVSIEQVLHTLARDIVAYRRPTSC